MNRTRLRRFAAALSGRLRPALEPCWLTMVVVLALGVRPAHACVGSGCLQIWSTADGGGALTIQWDFTRKVQTYQSFCAADNSQCLYSTIDPGFMAPTTDSDPADAYYVLADTTVVNIVIIAADVGLSMHVNGQKLYQPGDTAQLGVMPTIHNHPSWQIVVPGGQYGDFNVSFKLTTVSPSYTESPVYTQVVTNVPPPEQTPTPTPAPTITGCPGDCNADASVTINEILVCVNMAIGTAAADACPACDVDADGSVTVNEIIAAVGAALSGCPTPVPATLEEIQATIFTPSCATATCHDAVSKVENLDLSAGAAYGQLVNVSATTDARLRRVDPGHPESSFLLTKVSGPPPGEGGLMPLTGTPLDSAQIQLIHDWILQGANP